MISYFLDVALCGMMLLAEIFGSIILMLLVQLIFYRVFNINLYKSFFKFLYKMDKKLTQIFE